MSFLHQYIVNTSDRPGINYDRNICRAKTTELQAELERRGLSYDGSKSDLEGRIQNDNKIRFELLEELKHKPRGKGEQQSEEDVVEFHRFSKFPREIQDLVWKFSLLGPRVLSVSDCPRSVDKLSFYKTENPANPVALSVNKASRAVALKRYRLSFGTQNVYADLPGGDTLFFGPSWTNSADVFGENGWLWTCLQLSHGWGSLEKLSTNLVADLKEVRSIALDFQMWKWPRYPNISYKNNGKYLRADLKSFPRLDNVLLVHRRLGERNLDPLSQFGYFEVEEKFCNINMTVDEMEERYYKEAEHICRDFREVGLSEEEKKEKTRKRKKGVPDIKIVDMVRMITPLE